MSVHTPPCRSTPEHIGALVAERPWPSLTDLLDRWDSEREEEMRLAAIQDASDQVPTEMADWPSVLSDMAPGELLEVYGK
jgi:hypothetical protein